MTDKIIVLTTAGSSDEARRIADTLIERRQAACVNILKGVQSIYRWKGKSEESEEWMLLVKTTAASFESVQKTIKELHSYELPECMQILVEDGCPAYLRWIDESVGEKKPASSN
jgi:periplasmic divalent cation tolerance protein